MPTSMPFVKVHLAMAGGILTRGGIPFVRVHAAEEVLQPGIAAHSADIEYLEQDYVVENDPLEETAQESSGLAATWGLDAMGVPNARYKGRGVNVYVFDSGIRASHQEFGGRAIHTLDCHYNPPIECEFYPECTQDWV